MGQRVDLRRGYDVKSLGARQEGLGGARIRRNAKKACHLKLVLCLVSSEIIVVHTHKNECFQVTFLSSFEDRDQKHVHCLPIASQYTDEFWPSKSRIWCHFRSIAHRFFLEWLC